MEIEPKDETKENGIYIARFVCEKCKAKCSCMQGTSQVGYKKLCSRCS